MLPSQTLIWRSKEHIAVWPTICLLTCTFYLQQCWTNKCYTLLKGWKYFNFVKEQVTSTTRFGIRVWNNIYIYMTIFKSKYYHRLLLSDDHTHSFQLIRPERMFLDKWLKQSGFLIVLGRAGITFLDYLQSTWLLSALWLS